MPRGKKSKKRNKLIDMQVVMLIVSSILLGVLIYTKAGYIGETLSPILGGIMGWIKYVIPVGTFAMAIVVACDEDKDIFSKKIFQYAVLLLCISTVITVIQVSEGKISLDGGFEEAVKQAYIKGTENSGGGAVGAICATTLIGLLGKAGTIILVIGIAILDSVFLFGIKPAEILKNVVEDKKERKIERQVENEEKRKERAERRKENQEGVKQEKEEKSRRKEQEKEQAKAKAEILDDQISIKMADEGGLFKKQEEVKEDKSKEVLTLEHTLTMEDKNYEFPPIEVLKEGKLSAKSRKKSIT